MKYEFSFPRCNKKLRYVPMTPSSIKQNPSRKANSCTEITRLLWNQKVLFFLLALQPNSGLGHSMKLPVSLQLLDLGQSTGLLRRVISSSTCTQTQKNANTTRTLNIHALSGIQTQSPDVRASDDSSRHRPLG
jgi:hypothetical protein